MSGVHGWTRSARRWTLRVALTLAAVLAGAVIGAVIGVATPAHVEIAGSDARIWLEPGKQFDQAGVTGVVSLKRPAVRSVLGEPIGVRAVLDLDASAFVGPDGKVNSDVLPAYIAAYSDPDQLVDDIGHALLVHLLSSVAAGAALGLLLAAAVAGYRAWRSSYDRRNFPDPVTRSAARAYRRPERVWLRRTAGALVVAVLLVAIPSSGRHPRTPPRVEGNPILAGTPLDGVEVDGLLSPALLAARNYVQTYVGQTNAYYSALRDELTSRLDSQPVALPGGPGVEQIGFVTDRHCNTGMDRVTVSVLKQLGVRTLVSAGDDAFSGTFSFESTCTGALAELSAKAGITDVFAAGNHDSAQTVADEKSQGMTTLRGSVVTVNGLSFVGSPDPRSSRYGEGIQPASDAAQSAAVDEQGARIGATACRASGPVIAVLHDPRAGTQAIASGCGKVTLALDGHTHKQAGPVAVPQTGGVTGTQFTGGSAGGAPGGKAVDRTFASRLTVGPLNHDAFVYIVGVARDTGRPVAITTFRFTPAQDVEVTQTYVP